MNKSNAMLALSMVVVSLFGAIACGVPQEDYDAVVGQLGQSVEERDSLDDQLQQATSKIQALTESVDSATTEIELLEGETERLGEELSRIEQDYASLTAERDSLAEEHAALEDDYELLLGEYDSFDAVQQEHEALQVIVDSLNAHADDLRSVIQELDGRRRPLIVDSSIGHFACTGSMEPKITCLDEATWLDNFNPADITIGTVISFTPVSECRVSGDRIAHRVIEIDVINGVYYFLPKGDNNDVDDGCWIPETNVNGYIIELHEDVRPENAALRDKVNAAKASAGEARAAYEAARDEYYSTWADYCGGTAGCAVYSFQHNHLLALYNNVIELSIEYEEAAAAYDEAVTEARLSA